MLVPVMSVMVSVLGLLLFAAPDILSTLPLLVMAQPGLPPVQFATSEKFPLPVKFTTAAFAHETGEQTCG
jgi:hypothetical protein